jgi:hypothetical protein
MKREYLALEQHSGITFYGSESQELQPARMVLIEMIIPDLHGEPLPYG